MNRSGSTRPRRVAFVAASEALLQVPVSCAWADARVVSVDDGDWTAAAAALAVLSPDVTIAVAPDELDPAILGGAGTCRVLVLSRAPSDAALRRISAAPARTWITIPEPVTAPPAQLLRIVPPTVDVSRLGPVPRLHATRVAIPAWAAPPDDVMRELRRGGEVDLIPRGMRTLDLAARVAAAGLVVHWSPVAPGRDDDLLPVLALAAGALVVTRAAFPAAWAIEEGDEYVHAAHTDALLRSVAEFRGSRERLDPVRVRAWQRAKEWFDASRCFERLVSDLELALEDGAR